MGCKPKYCRYRFVYKLRLCRISFDEIQSSGERVVNITGVKNHGEIIGLLCRGANKVSPWRIGTLPSWWQSRKAKVPLHLALNTLYIRALIAGDGAPEIEITQAPSKHSRALWGTQAICIQVFADASEIIQLLFLKMVDWIRLKLSRNRDIGMRRETRRLGWRKGRGRSLVFWKRMLSIQPLLVTTSA